MKDLLDKIALIHIVIQDKLDGALYGDVEILARQAHDLKTKYWELRNEK